MPHFNDPNGQIAANKLLHVLSSRARKHLHLISEKDEAEDVMVSMVRPNHSLLAALTTTLTELVK